MKKPAALVLSGGGSLGAAHIGALRHLEQKYKFPFLAGVSAGAIVAASIACGKTADEIMGILQKKKLLQLAFDFTKNNFGLLRGDKILTLLREFYDDRTFRDLEKGTKLYIGATDFSTGKRVTISKGNIAEAVRASLSVPILFQPCLIEDAWLVDGGLSQNFPLDIALKKYKGDLIIGIDVATSLNESEDFSVDKFWGKLKQMQRMLERTFRIFFRNQQSFTIDARTHILRPDLTQYVPFDVLKLDEIAECGFDCAQSSKL